MKHIYTTIVNTYLNNRTHNKFTNTLRINVHHFETTLPRATRRSLSQLRTNNVPSSFHIKKNRRRQTPITTMPQFQTEPHTTINLFKCTKINTQLRVTDLWMDPVEVWSILDEWRCPPVSQQTGMPARWGIPRSGYRWCRHQQHND